MARQIHHILTGTWHGSNTSNYIIANGGFERFLKVKDLPCCVKPSVPILFFGDLDAYSRSTIRVVTVGKNPSHKEFPSRSAFERFPLAENMAVINSSQYVKALSAYFKLKPYSRWFNGFEPILNVLNSSYYDKHTSVALHTDICSPIATNPTWTKIGNANREGLLADGVPLWHNLLNILKPQLVLLSFAKEHLHRIQFEPHEKDWQTVISFAQKANGLARKTPYEVKCRWYKLCGSPTLFAFGVGNFIPFQYVETQQKLMLAAKIKEEFQNGH